MPSIRHKMAVRLVNASLLRPADMKVEAARLLMDDFAHLFPMPDSVDVRSLRAAGLEAEWIVPSAGAPKGAVLYLHGGGYCAGSIASHRALAARLALASRCRVLLIDYALAPERPFPAGLRDAERAFAWLLDEGVAPERLIVAGDSAGGGLTLALLVALERAGTPRPAGAVCLSPWADLTMSGTGARSGEIDDPMIRLEDAERLAALYAGGEPLDNPLVSPLFARLGGLPPLLLQVGTREILLDDARRVAEAARRAGVEVRLEEWPELMHVWQIFAPMVPESVEAIEAIGRWITERLERSGRRSAA